jgi:hypothetical protein
MSAIGFDTLKFARKLKEAGVPNEQAEAQAEVLGEAFLYNLDQIVTRDYMDPRLEKIEAHMDGIDVRLDGIDARLDGIEARLNTMDQRFIKIDGQFRLMYWMLGMIVVVNVIPILTNLLS